MAYNPFAQAEEQPLSGLDALRPTAAQWRARLQQPSVPTPPPAPTDWRSMQPANSSGLAALAMPPAQTTDSQPPILRPYDEAAQARLRQELEAVQERDRIARERNTGALEDLGTRVMQGVARLPGQVAGLADIPVAAVTGKALVSDATDWVGEQTGFQPGQYAEKLNQKLSPAAMQAKAEIDQAWDQASTDDIGGSAAKVAGAYLRNPVQGIAGLVAESAPLMLAGGALGRAAAVGGKALQAGTGIGAKAGEQMVKYAPAIGEGGIAGGAAMDALLEQGVDPRLAAGASAGTALTTGFFGHQGRLLAQKLGYADLEASMAGVAGQSARQPRWAERIAGGAAIEGLAEELPQSVFEQGWQNAATGRPLTEGMARAGVEGAIAGTAMGAVMNILPPTRQALDDPTVPDPERAKAAADIAAQLAQTDPDLVQAWNEASIDAIAGRKPVNQVFQEWMAGQRDAQQQPGVDQNAANQGGAGQNPGANPAGPASGLGAGAPVQVPSLAAAEQPLASDAAGPSSLPNIAEPAGDAGAEQTLPPAGPLTQAAQTISPQPATAPTQEELPDGKATIPPDVAQGAQQGQSAGPATEQEQAGLLDGAAPISAEAESGASGLAAADAGGPAGDPTDPGAAVSTADAAQTAQDELNAPLASQPDVPGTADRAATPASELDATGVSPAMDQQGSVPQGAADQARPDVAVPQSPSDAQAELGSPLVDGPDQATTDETLNTDQPPPIPPTTPPTGDAGTATPAVAAAQADQGAESAAASTRGIDPASEPTPAVQPEPALTQPAPLAQRWETMTAPEREAVVASAGGLTNAKGGLNVSGRRLVGKQWDKMAAATRAKLEQAVNLSAVETAPAAVPAALPAGAGQTSGTQKTDAASDRAKDGYRRFTTKGVAHPLSGYLGNKKTMIDAGAYDGVVPEGASFSRIIEPFGGSGLLGNVLQTQISGERVLNDLDPQTSEFHRQTKDDPDGVVAGMRKVVAEIEQKRNEFDKSKSSDDVIAYWKAMIANPDGAPHPSERAARTLIRNNGSLSVMGKNQRIIKTDHGTPKWNVAPDLADKLEAQIRAHHASLKSARLTSGDARAALAEAGAGDLVPVDPPYVAETGKKTVSDYAVGKDLTTIAGAVDFILNDVKGAVERGALVIYTNYARPEIIAALQQAGLQTKIVERRSQRGTKPEVVGFSHPVARSDAGRGTDTRKSVGQNDSVPRGKNDIPNRPGPERLAGNDAAAAPVDRAERAAGVLGGVRGGLAPEPSTQKAADRRKTWMDLGADPATRFNLAPAKRALPDIIDVDGVQRSTQNSEGKPIHPTEEGIRNFWRWFAGSKVVDDQGRPLVVYHATTNAGFSVFYPESHFGTKGQAHSLLEDRTSKTDAIYPVYLSVQNPKRTRDAKHDLKWEQYIETARKETHDGIVYLNTVEKDDGQDVDSWIAFDPAQIKSAIGNAGTFDGTNPDIRFKTADQRPAGDRLTVDFLQARLNVLTARWPGLKQMPVKVVGSERALPEAVRAKLAEMRANGTEAIPRAVYVPGDGMYFVAPNLANTKEALLALAEEAIGHHGLRSVMGPQFDALLDRVLAERQADVQAMAADYGLDLNDRAQALEAAEEYLAHQARLDSKETWFQAIVQAIRQMLRKIGLNLRLSDGDIRALLAASNRYVTQGDARAALRARERFGGQATWRGRDARFMFAGERAATADKLSLSSAQARLDAGEDAEAVRQGTGWFKGNDGKWRFEIDDSDARFLPAVDKSSGKLWTKDLQDVIDHPALFAAYPSLRTMQVESVIGMDKSGSYRNGVIQINSSLGAVDQFSTLLHEIQHGIQHVDGFAKGGTPKQFDFDVRMEQGRRAESAQRAEDFERKVLNGKTITEVIDESYDLAADEEITDDEAQKRIDQAQQAVDDAAKSDPFYKNDLEAARKPVLNQTDRYTSLAGEVEARNTQARQSMTVAERRQTSPSQTADVADADVIVMFNGQEAASAPMPENAGLPATINVDGVQRPTHNSNGQPIHPTEEGVRNFWRWFGESKVVDDQGRPLVVYHGTSNDFSVFDPEKIGSNFPAEDSYGFFFATNAATTMAYGTATMPVYLKAGSKTTFDYDINNEEWAEIVKNESQYADNAVEITRDEKPHIYIVFDQDQIKSAIGNTGDFSPSNPDIRFSLAGPRGIADIAGQINDRIERFRSPSIQKIGLWDRTVGTPFNLSKRYPETFGKVYRALTDYMDRSSTMAMEAESLAPNFFTQMERGLIEAFKSGRNVAGAMSQKEVDAVQAALNEGTLAKVRYGNEALRARGLNDRQIASYNQALRAAHHSLDATAQTFQVQQLRALIEHLNAGQPKKVRRALAAKAKMILGGDDVTQAAEYAAVVTDSFLGRSRQDEADAQRRIDAARQAIKQAADREAGQRAKADLKAAKDALATAEKTTQIIVSTQQSIDGIAARVQQLKQEAYFPLMRFGRFTLTVYRQDPDTNEKTVVRYSQFATEDEMKAAADGLRAELGPDQFVVVGTKNEDAYKQFEGLNMDTLSLFADQLENGTPEGMKTAELMREYIRLATAETSALKRTLQRKGIAGYSTDAQRVLASFIVSNSRMASSNLHMGEIRQAIEEIPQEQGDLQQYAQRLQQYIQDPTEELAGLRSFMFVWYLGGSVASAVTNLTQIPMVTLPYLTQFKGGSAKNVLAAYRQFFKGPPDENSELGKAYKRAELDGLISPQGVYNLMATARGGTLGAGKILRHPGTQFGLTVWGSLFSMAEQANRQVTFIAAYNQARARGESDASAYSFAEDAVQQTQFVYRKENRPQWSRGLAAPLFTFKLFTVSYLEMLARMPAKQKALMLATLVVAAGLTGLPGEDDAEDLIDTIMQWAGYNFQTRDELQKWAEQFLGETVGKMVLEGVSAGGLTFDLHSRLGMGNLIPGTGILKPGKANDSREVTEIFGPAAGVLKDVGLAAEKLGRGEAGAAGYALMPRALKAFLDGYAGMTDGAMTDRTGKPLMDITATEAAFKLIGFQPRRVAEFQDKKYRLMARDAHRKEMESAYLDRLARAQVKNDQEGIKQARAKIADWNKRNPDDPIEYSRAQLRARVKALKMMSSERFLRALSPELRKEATAALQ